MSFAAVISALSGSTDAGAWDFTADTYQTSGGSAAGNGDPVGSWLDGINGYEFVNGTAGERPVLSTTNGLDFDGTDDSLTCSDFPSLSSMTNHVIMMELESTDGFGVLFYENGGFFAGVTEVSGSSMINNWGSPTFSVDGGTITTRSQLHTALSDAAYHVFEGNGGSFSAWSEVRICYFSASAYRLDARVKKVLICSASDRSTHSGVIETWMGLSAGSTTGTAAQTFPTPSQSASGAMQPEGTAAQTFDTPSQSASGTETLSGTAAQTMPLLGQAASGTETLSGTAAQTIATPSQSASGAQEFTGTAAQTFETPSQVAAGTGSDDATGSASQSVSTPSQDASGVTDATGTGAQIIPFPSQSAVGTVTNPVVPDAEVSRETAYQIHYPARIDDDLDDNEVMRMVLAKFAEMAR